MNKDYYEVLGLDATATSNEIKTAYRKLASKYHPDKLSQQSEEQAGEHFKEIEEAYRVLKDSVSRAHYDQTGEGKMPKSSDIAVKKIVHLFQKYIRMAVEKELAMESLNDVAPLSNRWAGPDSILAGVRGELEKERKEMDATVDGLTKAVAKLNKYKRKVISRGKTNLYLQVIEQQLQGMSAALASAGIELIALGTALESLDDYSYVPEFLIEVGA